MKLDIYVNYPGKCEEAFRFYEQHLGGKISMMMTHEQQPNQANVPANWKKAILHARVEIGKTVLMGADIPGAEPMRSAYLTLTVDSAEEAERLYALLSGGDLFRLSLCDAPGQVRHVLDAAPRTSSEEAAKGETRAVRVVQTRWQCSV